jgi:FdhE protein
MNARSQPDPAQSDLARAMATLRALAAAVRATPVQLSPGVPDSEAADARLAGGVPALHGEALVRGADVDPGVAAVAAALAGTEVGSIAAAVRDRLHQAADWLDRDLVAHAAVNGDWDLVQSLAVPLEADPDALVAVLDWAVRPALRSAAAALAPVLAASSWARGHCPACGAAPTLSVMRGKERERRLHCGRCGTSWAFDRVRCPSCGERDHRRLGYLHAEGEGEYRRAEVCDGCRTYVKSVSLLDEPDADRLLELDFETAALDFLALEGGYARAGASSLDAVEQPEIAAAGRDPVEQHGAPVG